LPGLELVLGLVEDQPEQALFVVEGFEGVAVVVEEVVASHLGEEQIGELFDVVAACPSVAQRRQIAHAAVAEDVAEVPEFVDDCGWGHFSSEMIKVHR